jgi:membrane-associated PAP2 superfamily phosphatase
MAGYVIGVLIDAAILLGIMKVISGEDAPEFWQIVLIAAGLAVVGLVSQLIFVSLLGPYGVFLAIPVLGGVAVVMFMFFCRLPLSKALLALGLFVAFKVALALTCLFALSGAHTLD